MDLTCPKCHGTMRQYERNSVLIDQCGECRGVFLDRGELDKLIDAEAKWADTAASAPAPPPQQPYPPQGYQQPPREQGYGDQRYREAPYRDERGYQQYPDRGYRQQYYKKNKKRSFLDELFD